jgi:DNA-binding NarL/FixJ family response regulator
MIRCVVADDHPPILDAVCRFLEREEGLEVVGRARDGEQALRLTEECGPDVALLDIGMPRLDGVSVTREQFASGSRTAVVLYTGQADKALLLDALDAGARGFVLKEAPLPDLARALRLVSAGGIYVDPALAGFLAGRDAAVRLRALSKREREILRMLADGMRNEGVAHHLGISPLTVRTHVKNAMDKLEADTRTQAVATALRRSLIS